jgi:hypothetical protein
VGDIPTAPPPPRELASFLFQPLSVGLFLGAAERRLWAHFFRVRGCGELSKILRTGPCCPPRALLSPESLYTSLLLNINSLRGSPHFYLGSSLSLIPQSQNPLEATLSLPCLGSPCPRDLLSTRRVAVIHPCIPAPLHPCTPASLHPCIPAPLHPRTPASLHPCIPASSLFGDGWSTDSGLQV